MNSHYFLFCINHTYSTTISIEPLYHAWDEPIGQFYTCLKNSGLKGPFWICAFSIYQSDGDGDSPSIGEQLENEPEYGPFSTVLKAAYWMVAVVTDERNIYTRLWYV